MNRLSECKEHLRVLAALNGLRGAGDWERHKRFTRDAVKHLVDAYGSVYAVIDAVWPFDADLEGKADFVSQLMAAALHRYLMLSAYHSERIACKLGARDVTPALEGSGLDTV